MSLPPPNIKPPDETSILQYNDDRLDHSAQTSSRGSACNVKSSNPRLNIIHRDHNYARMEGKAITERISDIPCTQKKKEEPDAEQRLKLLVDQLVAKNGLSTRKYENNTSAIAIKALKAKTEPLEKENPLHCKTTGPNDPSVNDHSAPPDNVSGDSLSMTPSATDNKHLKNNMEALQKILDYL